MYFPVLALRDFLGESAKISEDYVFEDPMADGFFQV